MCYKGHTGCNNEGIPEVSPADRLRVLGLETRVMRRDIAGG